MKKAVSILLCVALFLGLVACGDTDRDWQEQYDLGMRYLEDGDYEEAIVAFTAAIEIDGNRPEAYVGRAQANIALGNPEEALKDYKKAKRIARRSEEDYEDLIDELDEIIEALEDGNGEADWQEQYDLGMRYLENGDYEEAILAFMTAIKIDGGRPEAYVGRAEAFIGVGDFEKALKDYKKAKRIAEKSEEDYDDLIAELEEIIAELEAKIEGMDATDEGSISANNGFTISVTDVYSCQFTNSYGGVFCCHVPRINLENDLADSLNQRIYEEYYEYAQSQQYGFRYMWNVYRDMLSLVIVRSYTEYDWTEYRIYTISTVTGEEISQEELLEAYDMDEDSFYSLVSASLERSASQWTPEQIGEYTYQYIQEHSLSEENVHFAVPFVGADGILCMLCRYYTPAGAGIAYGLHQVSTDEVVGIPSCNGNHGTSSEETVHTVEQIAELVVQWYNGNIGGYESGYFTADGGDCFLIHDKCSVSVYFYETDTSAPGTEALPFAVVQVDVNTGEMWDVMTGNSLAYLW